VARRILPAFTNNDWQLRMTTKAHHENAMDLVQHSMLYKEFLAERDEILRHKWIESEKAGYDIGFERALIDWIITHRSVWLQTRRRCSSENDIR